MLCKKVLILNGKVCLISYTIYRLREFGFTTSQKIVSNLEQIKIFVSIFFLLHASS
jgi:hypothetical protein